VDGDNVCHGLAWRGLVCCGGAADEAAGLAHCGGVASQGSVAQHGVVMWQGGDLCATVCMQGVRQGGSTCMAVGLG
jgi:hypothetical protein